MNIELVVFDLAGTTVHDEDFVAKALQAVLADEHVYIDVEDANRVMGLPKPVAIEQLYTEKNKSQNKNIQQRVNKMYNSFLEYMINFYKNSETVREIDGVSETFEYLKNKGIKTSVDTGFSNAITEVILQRMQWREKKLLDTWVSSDEVPRGRPYPDMIQYLMKKTGVSECSKVAKVGDTPADLNEGANAGCSLIIGVSSGSCSFEELIKYPHTHIINSVAEIKRLNII